MYLLFHPLNSIEEGKCFFAVGTSPMGSGRNTISAVLRELIARTNKRIENMEREKNRRKTR